MNKDIRMYVIVRDMFSCQRCGKQPSLNGLQIAHRIHNGKESMNGLKARYPEKDRKWIQDNILDHPLNLVTTCSLRCNDSYNIWFNDEAVEELLTAIVLSPDILSEIS